MKGNWEVYYYPKPDGTYPVKEYINTLGKREKAKILSFIELLQDNGPDLKRPYADLLKNGIHEL
ncbi:MAG: hypothetical protein Ta2A_00930 [Treponemataceae bacterium]|nr:MAG: hypothetical protein Ta2A_00930 [Treponemataceae bacterium]